MATRRILLQLILAAALLFAQQAAVTHAIWHAHDRLAGHARESGLDGKRQSQGDGEFSSQAQLCGFHVALGQVLGGAHGSVCTFVIPELPSGLTAQSALPYSGSLPLSFHSRAPPVLL